MSPILKPTAWTKYARLAGYSRGAFLLESVVAVAIFTVIGAAVFASVSTGRISGSKTEGQSVAENVGRNQMEHIRSLPYQPPPYTYPAVTTPLGYAVVPVAQEYLVGEPNIEKIVVTVTRNGAQVLILETLRVNE